MVKKTIKQDKNKRKKSQNHNQTEDLGSSQKDPQNSNPWFLEATKNMLLNLSKKCRSNRKDSQIRKQWERQYIKNKGNKQFNTISSNQQRQTQQKQKERLNSIQIANIDERKQSKKRIQYQNQYLNKFLKDKQQKQMKDCKKKKVKFQLLKKWQNYYIDDQQSYMEVQLDQNDTMRSQSNFYGKQISVRSNSDQVFDYQQKETLKEDVNQSVQKKIKSNLANQDCESKQRISLYNFKLDELISFFISQLTSPQYRCECTSIKSEFLSPEITIKNIVTSKCKCDRPTAVHRTVAADLYICRQIQKIITLLGYQNRFQADFFRARGKSEYFQNNPFNQDRTILLNNKGSLKSDIFAEEIITPFDHRALAMLLKRINHKKYSLLVPKRSTNQRSKNYLLQKFYKEQYEKSIQEYYKQLLQLQLEYKRYAQITPSSQKIVIGKKIQKLGPSNFIRRMLTSIFHDKIRGSSLIKQEISSLEQEIDACTIAEVLLVKMRQNEINSSSKDHFISGQLKILPKILFKSQSQPDKFRNQNNQNQQNEVPVMNINKKYKFNPDLVGVLIDQNQKKSIQKTLLRFQKNKKQVPYPKCMFLQYRLRALRQQSYKNPNNPSSDQDQQPSSQSDIQEKEDQVKTFGRLKDLHVYKGYRGYKTQMKIMEERKRKKGISKNVQIYTNQELFYLRSLQDPKLNKQIQNEHFNEQRSDDLKQIPFPFYLSIFNQKKDQKGTNSEKIVQRMDDNNHKKSIQGSEVIELSD